MSTTICETREVRVNDEQEQRRLQLLKTIMCGQTAWSREARAALALAEERGVALDHDALVYSDVHDLQAMQWHLQATHQVER